MYVCETAKDVVTVLTPSHIAEAVMLEVTNLSGESQMDNLNLTVQKGLVRH